MSEGGNRMTYGQYRAQYEEWHPSFVPVLEKVVNPYPRWLLGVILAMFLAATIFSSVHTIPTAFETIPVVDIISGEMRRLSAHMVAVFIELGLFVSVYAAASSKSITPRIIQVIALAGAIAANLYSVHKALNANDDIGTNAVGIIFGVIAPLIALLSGEMYIRMHSAERRVQNEALERFAESQRGFDANVLAGYEIYNAEQDRIQADRERFEQEQAEAERLRLSDEQRKEAERQRRSQQRQRRIQDHSLNGSLNTDLPIIRSVNSLNEQRMNGFQVNGSLNSANGYTKEMNAKVVIREWLNAHPESMNDKLDSLHERITKDTGVTVGRTSIHNVRREIIIGSNGHSVEETADAV